MTDSRKPRVRAARPADFEAFYGRRLPYTARAWVAELDGEVIGIAGWYRRADGYALAFSDMTDAMRMWPGMIMREAKRFMGALSGPAVCVANCNEEGAARFLSHLGWRKVGVCEDGEVYAWQIP